MVISNNSQLGLMMDDKLVQVEFLRLMMKRNKELADAYQMIEGIVRSKEPNEDGDINITEDDVKEFSLVTGKGLPELEDLKADKNNSRVQDKIAALFVNDNKGTFIDNVDSKLYLICNGVEKCSKMIRIGDNFSSKALRNIQFGKHTYLMGKDEVCRFFCKQGGLKGVYWNRTNQVTFEFGFDFETDGYYCDELYLDYFNKVAKIITFVELGDIDVIMLEKGRNNGKQKNDGKITNTSPFTVYVVDSSWNQLIIRTEGFAVMGHYRLQPCGAGLIDRKLIWISAFEKHGYKRQPKARIIHE